MWAGESGGLFMFCDSGALIAVPNGANDCGVSGSSGIRSGAASVVASVGGGGAMVVVDGS